ncbi:type II toxin-antitoxin system PemK/MazF family toxin [Nocardioides ferulae]|uniref:type II toxin-antitoxin system PemK/MazF family toxin n=1 Tax=Nocardioides ferulae TaxID=2340821 RepID=UPI000EAF6BF0|nr:type II toxin-antitoxin system PemK/MazF family toxin [Nocardioides ferulae]
MLTPGDVVDLDLGLPSGSEAGLRRPAVVVTAARVLRGGPNVIQVVPLTRTIRNSGAEVVIEPDGTNCLGATSAAQCQHVRSVSTERIVERTGTVGPVVLGEVRQILALLLDLR